LRILPLIAALSLSAVLAVPAAARTVAPRSRAAADPPSRMTAGAVGDYLSARFAASDHDYGEASRLFRGLLARDGDNVQLATLAFYFVAGAGNIEDAARLAERVLAANPDERIARLTLAVAAMKHHDWRRARTEIAGTASGQANAFVVALFDGWAAAGAGDIAAAKADFQRLHAGERADGLAYFQEGLLAEMTGDKAGAEAGYKASLAAAGATPRVIEAYGRFLERNGRGAEARTLYTQAATENDYHVIAATGLARIAAGTIPEPLVPRAEEGAAEALFVIAGSLNEERERDVSILYLRLALYLSPRLDLATFMLADRFEDLGKFDDAIAAYRSIPQGSPFSRLAAVGAALDLARLDRNDEAIAALERQTAAVPDDFDAWSALANCYRVGKRYPQAISAYNRAIQLTGTVTRHNWMLLYGRAVAEHLGGDWTAAETDLRQALAINPNDPQMLNYLGYSLVDQQRNVAEALGMLERARALSPQDGYIIDSVGWAYYRAGRYSDAVNALEAAVALVPGDPTINDHLGDAYLKVGRRLDAQFQFNHALAFHPEPEDKVKIEQKLRQLVP
jgi:tetratricopeptide (TPR) repeat protein